MDIGADKYKSSHYLLLITLEQNTPFCCTEHYVKYDIQP